MSRKKSAARETSAPVPCPYCGGVAAPIDSATLYPHRPELHGRPVWACLPCRAWVGCHPGTNRPLGRLADADLRRAKMRAHAAFDPLWKSEGIPRGVAYGLLADALGISRSACHVGYFDVATCDRVPAAVALIRSQLSEP